MATAVIAGAIANTARRGGDTWHRLHWLLGMRRLGIDAHLIEQIASVTCVDEHGDAALLHDSINRQYFIDVLTAFGVAGCATLVDEDGQSAYGLTGRDARQRIDEADLFVNISGHLPWHTMDVHPRTSVFIDEDPGFTQMWHATGIGTRLDGYDLYVSVGANVGTARSTIPTNGLAWRTMRPFAVLDCWPQVPPPTPNAFTTVGGWRGPFGSLTFKGTTYGVKAHEFRKFADLPRWTPRSFELALDIHPSDCHDRELMESRGWRLVDPRAVAGDPHAFRGYVQRSGAEFSVAKGMYVQTNSGWFSDRTVRYLASGRPALVQDTGFTHDLPCGEGLIAFRTMNEAMDGIASLDRDYAAHCQRARAIAETYFDSDLVLGRLLEDAGVRI